MEKIATREAYGKALAEFGDSYDFVVLDADLAAATKTGVFKKKFPERFFDCGIAEGNMTSMAAGLAAAGQLPFISSFAMFSAGRAFEQVRNAIGYPHLNVKVVGTHAGITVGEDGATHQCNEDLALMRSIPGMVVINPSDAEESRAAVLAAIQYEGPMYLRFSRYATPNLTAEMPDYKFEIGKGVLMGDGSDVAIVACGYMVHLAMEARDMLAAEGISARVINMHTVKPLDTEILLESAKKCGCFVTAEEHNIYGGLGEAVAAALAETYPVPCKRVGVCDRFGRSGKVPELLEMYGLTAANIAKKAKEAIALKK